MSDPRITPPDRAGVAHTILRGRASLRHAPSLDAIQDNELLFGDSVTVFESKDGWALSQSAFDNYVGYVDAEAFGDPIAPKYCVTALVTPLLARPDVKSAAHDMLPLNARVKVLERSKGFVRIAPAGYVFAGHLAPLDQLAPDWVATAERFLAVPYVWGGKTFAGIDCSGLVQTTLASAGIASPRDTDQQEAALGADCPYLARKRSNRVALLCHKRICNAAISSSGTAMSASWSTKHASSTPTLSTCRSRSSRWKTPSRASRRSSAR